MALLAVGIATQSMGMMGGDDGARAWGPAPTFPRSALGQWFTLLAGTAEAVDLEGVKQRFESLQQHLR